MCRLLNYPCSHATGCRGGRISGDGVFYGWPRQNALVQSGERNLYPVDCPSQGTGHVIRRGTTLCEQIKSIDSVALLQSIPLDFYFEIKQENSDLTAGDMQLFPRSATKVIGNKLRLRTLSLQLASPPLRRILERDAGMLAFRQANAGAKKTIPACLSNSFSPTSPPPGQRDCALRTDLHRRPSAGGNRRCSWPRPSASPSIELITILPGAISR